MTDLDIAPVLDDTDNDDPEKHAHIVDQALEGNDIVMAMIEGTEVVALCGHRFIPRRLAEQFPVCQACSVALSETT